jgi:hypothetical protein
MYNKHWTLSGDSRARRRSTCTPAIGTAQLLSRWSTLPETIASLGLACVGLPVVAALQFLEWMHQLPADPGAGAQLTTRDSWPNWVEAASERHADATDRGRLGLVYEGALSGGWGGLRLLPRKSSRLDRASAHRGTNDNAPGGHHPVR